MKNINTEETILQAAKCIFQQKGMDGARMQEIADEAGINKAMLHYYYRNKQQLFDAVFKSAFSLLIPQLNKILNDDSSLEEKIRNFTCNYIDFVKKQPYLPNFIIYEINKNPDFIVDLFQDNDFPSIDKFKIQIEKEIEKGTIKPINAEQLFINLIALNAFPFVAAPLLKGIINIDDSTYQKILEERKTVTAEFIINAIKK